MYTRTCLGTHAHMPTHAHADTRGLDPEGTRLGEVGLQGSSGHMLAPGLCVALPPSLAPLPGLHRVGGSSPRGWGALGQLSEATESSGGFLIYL